MTTETTYTDDQLIDRLNGFVTAMKNAMAIQTDYKFMAKLGVEYHYKRTQVDQYIKTHDVSQEVIDAKEEAIKFLIRDVFAMPDEYDKAKGV